ncbi:MAG TPA: SDR family NAD(P)-dependent oxidoreductase [Candidatus Solibacter sp.]|nr:SDR family NAD(P)-dependent oxidoreductase [Candidatus Solibacter sp.]
MKIEGAGVLVTGASRGIGEATAIELAARGARVTIAARSQPELDRVATAISAAGGTCVAVIPTDVSDEAQVKAMVGAADEALGGVDILVNNAGLGLNGPVAEIDPADLHYVFQVNLFAPHVATLAALPGMLRGRRGHIVNVGSVASHIATPGLGGYSSTKFALKALSDVLRAELQGTGVHVSLICPGPIATHFVKGARGDRGGLPQKPVGAPASDVARCIARAISRNTAEAFVPAYYQALVGANSVAPQVMRVAGKRGMVLASRFAERFL